MFSTITTEPSTIIPKSIAPRVRRFAEKPKRSIMMNANRSESGIVIATRIAARRFPKKSTSTATLVVGNKAPSFSLLSHEGNTISSTTLKGSRYVLYFYPKDMTSGCTVEAHEFTALGKKFASKGVLVFGVSPDDIESHLKFIEKEGITFPLLSDLGHKLADAYGIWVEKSMYGKKYMGIERSTFVVDKDGILVAIYRKVSPEGHATCVLEDLSK